MSMTEQGLHFQRSLNLRISERTVFVDLQSVRAALGVDAESVLAMVDNGEIVWAFDIACELGASAPSRRELRFWVGELFQPENSKRVRLSAVVQLIIGAGETIRRGEIERQWVCSAQHVSRLIRSGELHEVMPGKISRASLIGFLTSRWQGNSISIPAVNHNTQQKVVA